MEKWKRKFKVEPRTLTFYLLFHFSTYPLLPLLPLFNGSPQSQRATRGYLGAAAPPTQGVERFGKRQLCLNGTRRLLAPDRFHAEAFEAQRTRPLHERVVRRRSEAVPCFPRPARRTQRRPRLARPTSGRNGRNGRLGLVQGELGAHKVSRPLAANICQQHANSIGRGYDRLGQSHWRLVISDWWWVIFLHRAGNLSDLDWPYAC